MIDMVKMSQEAENKFVGVNCGIMDQFAIGMGKESKAVLLDCNTLKYEYAPVELGDASIVISNTNSRRGLADSKYNERRTECERALSQLQKKLDVNSLGEISIEEFEANKNLIENETDRKRAKHAVYENQRTLEAFDELKAGNIARFGELMNESHISLRDDYEVTGDALDTLVELAWEAEGTIGSRMTGAGFGGCTVSIVKNENIDNFIKNVGEKYKEKIGLTAEFYIADIGDGARELI
jgi:galactokinase